jgi:type IV pilus assembly protein PilB
MVEEQAEGARIINLVNLALMNAVKEGASDIHIEPDSPLTRIRFRVDGTLQEAMTPRADLHPAIVSRIKVMGKMDIAERRMPQDGRIRVVAEGKDVDIRVSTMPTVQGRHPRVHHAHGARGESGDALARQADLDARYQQDWHYGAGAG